MAIKEIKFKDTIINIDDIVITYTHPFSGKECTGSIEDFGFDSYMEGYDEGYSYVYCNNEY